ncbi:MAG TPA: patatin-like phospholipase family protein, partial [Saprospiraceae bacterium]|nr:patatin-like phospholipase family protein [Saprospiraceae bacterium]
FFETGFNPGDEFYRWLETILKDAGIETARDLEQRMNDFPKELLKSDPKLAAKLAIVAADITTETKVVFPEMADLYFDRPERVCPAKFVRASMSIPLFFKPFVVDLADLPCKDLDYIKKWRVKADYLGKIPKKVAFVDGGIMSNFPIDIFHEKKRIPSRPTFGVRLGIDRIRQRSADTMLNIFMACFDGARNIRDYEAIKNNEDFRQLISYVDTDSHSWLNFDMSDADKLDLFKRGAQAAALFLSSFDWAGYKRLRKNLAFQQVIQNPDVFFENPLDALQKAGLDMDYQDRYKKWKESGKNLRILWMDSNPGNDFFEQQLLIAMGFEVVAATNAGSARALCGDTKPHLIVADFNEENEENELHAINQWFSTDKLQIPLIVHSAKQAMLNKRRPLPAVVQYVTYEPKQLLEVVLNVSVANGAVT